MSEQKNTHTVGQERVKFPIAVKLVMMISILLIIALGTFFH